MRHARQPLAQRRGGDTTGTAWPSIVATTTSLSGAAAGIASLLLYTDTLHLRLGVGMAAAGAMFSSLAVLSVRRDRQTRRELLAEAREDHAVELRFEVTRRDTLISALKQKVLEAEEIAILFEQRLGEEKERLAESEAAREAAEHDLAVLTAWVHQANAAAELTRSAVQSFHAVQPFEPVTAHGAQDLVPAVYATPGADQQVSATVEQFFTTPAERVGGFQFVPEPVFELGDGYLSDEESAAFEANVPAPSSAGLGPAAGPRPDARRVDVDLTPAAAVPLSPILAAAREQSPEVRRVQPQAAAPRPLRSAVLSVRDEIGFDVAPDVHSAAADPYLVPGVPMPRRHAAVPPARPVAPERLYRPYLGPDGTTGHSGTVDLTMYDETQQMRAVDGRKTGTA